MKNNKYMWLSANLRIYTIKGVVVFMSMANKSTVSYIMPIALVFIIIFATVIFFAMNYMLKNSKLLRRLYVEKEPMSIKGIIISVLTAIISFLIFYILINIVHYINYSSFMTIWFMQQYLLIASIGAIAIAVGLFIWGSIFYIGSIIGYIVNCIVVIFQQDKPTMAGGIYNTLIISAGFLIGIIMELIIRRKGKKLFLEISKK